MGKSDENFPGVIRPSNIQGLLKPGGGKSTAGVGSKRRALGSLTNTVDLAGRNSAVNNVPAIPVHRPLTRRFASQLTGKVQQESFAQEVKPTTHQSKECTAIDSDDHDVPMFVQHTEAMLEEIDRMDAEIEMEDIEDDEPVVDIDSCDKRNPLAVTEYIEDVYTHYKKIENMSCVPPNYMSQQFDINDRMRGILIDWLIEVHYKFDLMEETLYLTVNLIDRFLAVQSVVRKKLQLVGVTAMLLACKYEEVSVPVVEDLILISDKAYCRTEVLDMEKLMVNTLQFNLSAPTPFVFMRRFLKAAQSEERLEMMSFFIIELCLVEYEMLRFPPSLLAAAAIFTAQCTLDGRKHWSKTSEKHTNYAEAQLMECAKLMVNFHQKAGTGKLTGVHKKYSMSKYGYAAKTTPAVFLMDAHVLEKMM